MEHEELAAWAEKLRAGKNQRGHGSGRAVRTTLQTCTCSEKPRSVCHSSINPNCRGLKALTDFCAPFLSPPCLAIYFVIF